MENENISGSLVGACAFKLYLFVFWKRRFRLGDNWGEGRRFVRIRYQLADLLTNMYGVSAVFHDPHARLALESLP